MHHPSTLQQPVFTPTEEYNFLDHLKRVGHGENIINTIRRRTAPTIPINVVILNTCAQFFRCFEVDDKGFQIASVIPRNFDDYWLEPTTKGINRS